MTFLSPSSDIPWMPRNFFDSDWASDVIEFHGPSTAHCLGVRYKTLTQGGLKSEGEPIPGPLVWTEPEAWHLFKTQLQTTVCMAGQIAWRQPPNANQTPEGNWVVSARLAWDGPEGQSA